MRTENRNTPAPEMVIRSSIEHWTVLEDAMEWAMEKGRPYLNENYSDRLESRCRVITDPTSRNFFIVKDLLDKRSWRIPRNLLEMADFDPARWYQERLMDRSDDLLSPFETAYDIIYERQTFSEFMQANSGGTQSLSQIGRASCRERV